LKDYEDAEKWHNQFRIQVTNRIDEDIFRPLFYDGFGAPNVSIRVLAGMITSRKLAVGVIRSYLRIAGSIFLSAVK